SKSDGSCGSAESASVKVNGIVGVSRGSAQRNRFARWRLIAWAAGHALGRGGSTLRVALRRLGSKVEGDHCGKSRGQGGKKFVDSGGYVVSGNGEEIKDDEPQQKQQGKGQRCASQSWNAGRGRVKFRN